MKFKSTTVNMQPEILKRELGGELFSEITLTDAAFTNHLCKAGNPIDVNGNVVNGAVAVYAASTDTEVGATKTYYTRSGSAGSYVYTKVASPTGNPSTSSYYEMTKAADASPVGILYTDVTDDNPNATIIRAFAAINTANANSNAGITIADSVKTALSLLVFE